jgi:hypothetical protein
MICFCVECDQHGPQLVKMLTATSDAAETIRIIRAISEFPTSKVCVSFSP